MVLKISCWDELIFVVTRTEVEGDIACAQTVEPAAGLAILVRLPERLKDLLDIESMPLEIRYSEPQEYYFAMFLMLYLASLAARKRGEASES